MKTLIEVPNQLWANVRHYATARKITVNCALEKLLTRTFEDLGYKEIGG